MVSSTAVGRSVGHVEGPGKVSGAARYAGDISLPDMISGKCLRSPYPHARILSIDTSRARALAGVRAVITGADLPDRFIGRSIRDMYPLARDRVRFAGEKVAAVAADTPEIAEEALLLIDVEYEELPAVFDPIGAMQEGAPLVHDDPASYPGAYLPLPPVPNVVSQVFFRHGDVEAGFAEADRVFEHTFRLPSVHQGYLEPHACVVRIDPDTGIECWLSNKAPFNMRRQLSAAVQVPEERIRINLVPLGGDFGGKGSLMDAVVCYYLAERSGRPVKMVMTYTEELMAGNPRHTALIRMRTGVTNDGRMTARRATLIFNAGGYGGFVPSPQVNLHGAAHAAGPYRLPNVEVESLRVYTNTVPTGHMRAPGAPQAVFAEECHVDMIANELGLDPLEFRLRNALEDGDEAPLGERWHDIISKETLRAAATDAQWGEAKAPNVGRGISMYERAPGGGKSDETLTIDGDARITLLTAVPDTGTGSHTILQQIIAEELQVPLGSVAVEAGNTDTAAFDAGAGGSRVTHGAGQGTMAAAAEMRTALIELAARLLDVLPADVSLQSGSLVATDGQRLSLRELMARAQEIEEAPITRIGRYSPSGHAEVTSFAAQVAEVEVDRETGQVKLRRVVSAHDVGTILNPLTHQGQIEGGIVQAIGQALTEQLLVEDGVVSNVNLGDYKLPTIADIPKLSTVLVESKHGPAPYQGKAIGELSNVALPAAIANAVYDAVGVRLTELPITAEKVFQALHAGESKRQ
jgi:CO/xanthine dehydrogenase Mo-binding subunit